MNAEGPGNVASIANRYLLTFSNKWIIIHWFNLSILPREDNHETDMDYLVIHLRDDVFAAARTRLAK